MACQRPPEGWWCSRESGHDGPCAASPAEGEAFIWKLYDSVVDEMSPEALRAALKTEARLRSRLERLQDYG